MTHPVAPPARVSPDPCRICTRRMVPLSAWRAADKATRTAWKAAGYARAGRTDMCNTCRQRLSTQGTLGEYVSSRKRRVVSRWTSCVRCGQPERAAGELCRDCAEVTATMGERDAWAA